MQKKIQWYENTNLVNLMAFYLSSKEILTLNSVCKSLHQILDSNKIWWLLYNSAFKSIRTLDSVNWLSYPDNENIAKKSFKKMKLLAKSNYIVDPANIYKVLLYGSIGVLPKSETITRQFGDKYDLMASFSSKFVYESKVCQISNISVPKIDRVSEKDCIMIMIDIKSKLYEQILKNTIEYIAAKGPNNIVLLINGKDEYGYEKEKTNNILLVQLEDLLGEEKKFVINKFTEESLAKVAFLMINIAQKLRSIPK